MSHTLTALVDSYGLLAIFVLMAGESCGLPISSEIVVPLGGALAATGHLNLVAVVVVAAAANLAGSLVAYWLADRFGRPLLLGRAGRYLGIRKGHLTMAERWFKRHGLAAVFVGRLLPVIRTYISFPAGFAEVPVGRFAALTFIGALPWNAALALAGYKARENWSTITKPVGTAAAVMAVLVVVGLVVWFIQGRRSSE